MILVLDLMEMLILEEVKICKRGCNTKIIWKGKVEGKKNSTGYFEYDQTRIEHTYNRCDMLLKKQRPDTQENLLKFF